MLAELETLRPEPQDSGSLPFILMAGERRSYNANQIFRDPAWRKVDREGALRVHPGDAETIGRTQDGRARVESAVGGVEVKVEIDDSVRPGVVTLPHGYGGHYDGRGPIGPAVNRLTASTHCDPFTRTPYHKYVPVKVLRVPDVEQKTTPEPAEMAVDSGA